MLGFVFSVIAYVTSLVTFGCFALFVDGLFLRGTVDRGAPVALGEALLVNIGLLLVFGAQHSLMARRWFKDWSAKVVPPHLERSTYLLASSVALVGLMLGWKPMPGVLWEVTSTPLVIALWSLNVFGWCCVAVSTLLIDHLDLFGLRQPLQRWRGQGLAPQGFVMPWLYRYVRHPMMTGLFIGLWATPSMALGHFCLSLGLSAYIVIGVHCEERSLRRELGESYGEYQRSVPMFLPRFK